MQENSQQKHSNGVTHDLSLGLFLTSLFFHVNHAWWPSGNGVGHINEVTLGRAWLVLRWVTFCRYTTLVCYQPTQPPTFSGTGTEYWLRGSA